MTDLSKSFLKGVKQTILTEQGLKDSLDTLKTNDLMSQLGAIAAGAMNLKDLTPDGILRLAEGVVEQYLPWIKRTEDMMNHDVLLSTYKAIILSTPLMSKNPADRSMWLNHMLAIMAGETGLTMDPQATNASGGHLYAYGLLQHTPDNWRFHSEAFGRSEIGAAVAQLPIVSAYAKSFHTHVEDIVSPLAFYGPGNAEIYQLFPMLAQTRALGEALNANWFWSEKDGRWKVKNQQDTTLKEATEYLLGSAITSFLAGRQILLTLLHTNGVHWPQNPTPPKYFPARGEKDVRAFTAMATHGLPPTRTSFVEEPVTHGDIKGDKAVTVNSIFGATTGRDVPHKGIDILVANVPFYSPVEGTVAEIGINHPLRGTWLRLRRSNGDSLVFMHLSRILVTQGSAVKPLQKLGVTGGAKGLPSSGDSHGPHLHMSYYSGNQPVDPMNPNLGVNLNAIIYPSTYSSLGDYKYTSLDYKDQIYARYPSFSQKKNI